MMSRVTPPLILELKTNEIFVFGSNESGRHGKGAAKTARKWGARNGVGEGLCGQTYAIPTKNCKIATLSTKSISKYVTRFIQFASEKKDVVFLVTEIGCGLANLKPSEIAPMFLAAMEHHNIYLPQSFWDILGNPQTS